MRPAAAAVLVAFVAALAWASQQGPPPTRTRIWITPARERALTACVSTDCGPHAVTLRWQGVTIAGQTGYYVFLNGTQIADTTVTQFTYYGADCGVSFTLGVEAHDAAGNHTPMYSASYTSPACAARSGPPVPAKVSLAYDLGYANQGATAPLNHMTEDALFTLETVNGCPDTGCAVWAAGTSYAAGAVIAYPSPDVVGNNATVYKSLIAGNAGNQPDTHPSDWQATTDGSDLDVASQGISPDVNVPSWVSAVHAAGDLAIISIGGASDQNWEIACDNIYRSQFVANLIQYMVSNGFDGVDLDMEDSFYTAQGPPYQPWTTCADAIATAAHATTSAGHEPIVMEDVITNWEGSWVQPYVNDLDQINLMSYGDTCSSATSCPTFQTDATDTLNQVCPSGGACVATQAAKFTLGLDMADNPTTESSCGLAASYALAHGWRGVIVWELAATPTVTSCLAAIATAEGL